ncbi:MAG: endonuclease III [Candidatus Bathyarchaeota archaeon]|nr:MAG: endonuclease III [Candidatus Bathyarchaeota archaeon]
MEEHYGSGIGQLERTHDPFKTLVGCVLSHRTRDENSTQAMENLFQAAERPEDMLRISVEELRERIRCSGFYKQKARNIRAICQTLIADYEGQVPRDRSSLMDLPGVGPKTADVVLSYAFDQPAIAVDTHVETVAKRLGLVGMKESPDVVKAVLESLVPPEKYRLVDNAFVMHGREFCRKRHPRCDECFMRSHCCFDHKIAFLNKDVKP